LRFNNIEQFLAARPAAFSRNIGNPYIGLRGSEWNGYIQDDWHLHPRLTVNAGLRYEFNSVPEEVNGFIENRFRFRRDFNNFAPRVGLAWRFGKGNQSVLRAGYGVYHNVLEWDFIGLTRFNPPLVQSVAASSPAFPDLLAGARVQIPSGLVIPDVNLRQPYSQHLQLTLERQFGRHMTASAGYLGTVGLKLPRASLPNGGDGLAQARRTDPSVGVVTRLETAANSNYHGMVNSLNWQGEGLQVTAAYTWAKSIDQVSDIPNSNLQLPANVLPLDASNWALNRGPADTDVRHVATFSYVWELPVFGNQRWLKGWQISGALYSRSGVPVTLLSGTDTPFGVNNNRILALPDTLVLTNNGKRPFRLADGVTRNVLSPAAGSFGTLGRNTHRSAGLLQWNAGLQKQFFFSERLRLQVRAETFNLLNRANYDVPDAVLTSPTFGTATAAFESRQGQVALRLEF